MSRRRRHHLSDEVEEAIWHYGYGCPWYIKTVLHLIRHSKSRFG